MKTPPIPIVQPCTADWQAMSGDDRQRLCAQCQKHVHNLSALTAGELRKFVAERDGSECIGYEYDERGRVVLAPRWPGLARFFHRLRTGFGWALAAILPAIFSGCAASRPGGSPGQTVGGSRRAVMPGTPLPPPIERKASRGADGTMLLGEVCPPPAKVRGKAKDR